LLCTKRTQILRLKCTKFAYSAPPDHLAGFKGPTYEAGEGKDRRERREGKGRGFLPLADSSGSALGCKLSQWGPGNYITLHYIF